MSVRFTSSKYLYSLIFLGKYKYMHKLKACLLFLLNNAIGCAWYCKLSDLQNPPSGPPTFQYRTDNWKCNI